MHPATAAAALNSSDIKEAKDVFMKALNRMALFGAMPPSILPALVSVRTKVDLPKTADRKLLRLVNYMIQLAAGEGSAGTVVPFSTLLGERSMQAHTRSQQRSLIVHKRGDEARCLHMGRVPPT